MNLQEMFKLALVQYPIASQGDFARNDVAPIFVKDIPKLLLGSIDDPERFKIKGSAGNGNWSRSPWIAIFDILITDSAADGYYPVFLFREDFSGFYLSLNQGVTDVKKKYSAGAKKILRLRATDFRARISAAEAYFLPDEIDLRASSKANLSSSYEAGNIISKFYPADAIPPEEKLIADLRKMLSIYEVLSYNDAFPQSSGEIEDDESHLQIEDLRRFRLHKRIERNVKLSSAAKKVHGTTCQVCKMNFRDIYGEIGRGYIEAHHLTPVAQLKGQKILLDPKKDFAVLCANCHRMIHRSKFANDLKRFREEHLIGYEP